MSITTILFDLDGTLLPMGQDEFVRAYFKLLAKKNENPASSVMQTVLWWWKCSVSAPPAAFSYQPRVAMEHLKYGQCGQGPEAQILIKFKIYKTYPSFILYN